jgi:hypothetical protein
MSNYCRNKRFELYCQLYYTRYRPSLDKNTVLEKKDFDEEAGPSMIKNLDVFLLTEKLI